MPGNHDNISSLSSAGRRERFWPLYQSVFDYIWKETSHIWLGDSTATISHYPPAEISDHGSVDRYPKLRPFDNGNRIFLHGHTHSTEKVTRLSTGSVAVHIGVDAWNYCPVSLDDVTESLIDTR